MLFGFVRRLDSEIPSPALVDPAPPTVFRRVSPDDAWLAREAAASSWVRTGMLAIVLGLVLAKYSQVWAGYLLHPGTIFGTVVTGCGVAVALLSCGRLLGRRYAARRRSRSLMLVSVVLIVALGWAALAIIWFAGWELPALRQG